MPASLFSALSISDAGGGNHGGKLAERPAVADAGEGARRRPPLARVWPTPLVEARAEADLGGRWRIRARAAVSVGEFLRWCALGKAELWSHGVNDARSGPAPNWRSRC